MESAPVMVRRDVRHRLSSFFISVDVASFKSWGVVGLTLLVLTIFSNPITWNLRTFWIYCGDVCQNCWHLVLDRIGEDHITLWMWGPYLAINVVYWTLGSCFTLIDLTLKPEVLRKYKTQPGTNEPVETKKLMKALGVVLFNHVIVDMLFIYCLHLAMLWRGTPPARELPTFHWAIISLTILVLLEEVGFYYSHRLLHSRHLYRHVHKLHHEWTAPIAITTVYCHPIEHIVANLMPPALGLLLLGSHVVIAWIMLVVFIISSMSDHSGYHLPFFRSPEFHDFHHLKFTQNYGLLGILDWLHGTDNLFVSSGYSRRHDLLTSLTPMRELHPIPTTRCKVE